MGMFQVTVRVSNSSEPSRFFEENLGWTPVRFIPSFRSIG
jgi:hypothetical protein